MNKNVLAGLLGAAALGVVIYQLFFAGPPPLDVPTGAGNAATPTAPGAAPGAPAATNAPTRLTKVVIKIDELLKNVEEVTFDYESMRIQRDPLTPLVGQIVTDQPKIPGNTEAPVGLRGQILRKRVTGIIYDEYSPKAVVDKEIVGPGDTCEDGTKVLRIEKDKVIFQLGDSEIPVEMKEL